MGRFFGVADSLYPCACGDSGARITDRRSGISGLCGDGRLCSGCYTVLQRGYGSAGDHRADYGEQPGGQANSETHRCDCCADRCGCTGRQKEGGAI